VNIISLDVSSSNLGASEFIVENNKIVLTNIQNFLLNSKLEIYQRFFDFEKYVENKKYDLCVMEARLKSFFPGRSNKNAILAIAAANEIVSYIMYHHSQKLIKLHPNSWRKKVGIIIKRKVKINIKEVVIQKTIENEVFQEYLLNNDLSQEEVFSTKIISRGKNKGKTVFIPGVNDKADSFLIGIAGINDIEK